MDRGQAYDGASNLSGHLIEVAAKILRDVPSALFVDCLEHCMNLTLQAFGHQCGPVRDALDLIMELTKLILVLIQEICTILESSSSTVT